ncbi:MAG TPA: GNAT family N-acetyltransferase [Caldimonas sp.]|jgi:ribosomal protein S18 acetylase RimI-like enzyme
MNAEEFAAYVERAIPEFANDKVASGQWSRASSLELSRQGYDELLPKGLATPENFLFTLRVAATQVVVGALWYAVQERAGQRIAYVYDVLVEPQYRRMGYATQVFRKLEAEVRSRGLCGIALHVFGHNEAARALYAKLGYQATNIVMFKEVPNAGT